MKTSKIYDVFDKNRKYYIQGIYCMKSEINPKDFVFHYKDITYRPNEKPFDIVDCCLKCT